MDTLNAMSTAAQAHFVFVDFENIPELELGLLEGKPVQVTLLIGKNQAKLDFDLVEQIHRMASQVELVKLGVSGRNALDLTLSYCLGQAVLRHGEAHYYIISKDKDFDPLISYVQGKGHKVLRCEGIATLPFLAKPKKAGALKAPAPAKGVAEAKPDVRLNSAEAEERFANLIARLKNNLAPRPKKKSSLLAHIKTAFGGKIQDGEVGRRLDDLLSQRIVCIDTNDRVTYPPH